MLENFLKDIRAKIKKIETQNEQLKIFNYKLESLLVSIDTYSIEKETKEEKVSYKRLTPDLERVSKILKKEETSKINKKHLQEERIKIEEIIPPDMSHSLLDTSLLFDTKNDLLSRALADSNIKKSSKGHLIKILEILESHKDGILWEEIIKKSGVPRYKCIEILNCLGKTDPPIMIKRRDKGFTCYINKNK
ncbi:uncharacterized protein VNE69_12074 [Vairimorpha necatrix]|uniref:HTH HARE-type domain-containing protein n=1 Tax=Vairimorpha necatrix TaxID=6039 RepID=A0AAX4JGJ9_9MICR